jgi:hypothetical protein
MYGLAEKLAALYVAVQPAGMKECKNEGKLPRLARLGISPDCYPRGTLSGSDGQYLWSRRKYFSFQ